MNQLVVRGLQDKEMRKAVESTGPVPREVSAAAWTGVSDLRPWAQSQRPADGAMRAMHSGGAKVRRESTEAFWLVASPLCIGD